ncbi:MAG: XrtN system VIT domain-containing protein [Saprospiraceae bacterium]
MLNPAVLKDKIFLTGVGLFAASVLIFLFTYGTFLPIRDDISEIFFVNYPLFIIYFIVVGGANRKQFGAWYRFRERRWNALLLLLFNMSAYALNRALPVFQESTPWLTGFLMTLNAAVLIYCLRDTRRPDALNYGLVLIFSAGLLFNIYEAIYIFELYAVGVMACWFFGISVHAFVPLMWCGFLSKLLYEHLQPHVNFWQAAIAGWVIPLAIVGWFAVKWQGVQTIVDQHQTELKTTDQSVEILPDWVRLAQHLKADWVTKRAIKSGLVYSIVKGGRINWMPAQSNWLNERTEHDPLVVTASFFVGNIDLDAGKKVKLYKALYNKRHQTERRLWSGNHLYTDHIETTVQLFPEYRVAYTERLFDIKHSGKQRGRWNGAIQEAIYSFYLPAGSVVTSASLWVDGEERPAYLTTKSKADSAYTTIVGRERRDPLVIHWSEGNRVSVRVFPVRYDLPRKFKIGVTTPLAEQDGQLVYPNIDFEGPQWLDATENVTVLTEGATENMDAPWGLYHTEEGWKYEGAYLSDWSLTFDAPPLATEAFSFNGRRLQLEKYEPKWTDFQPQKVYLDVNAAWDRAWWEQILVEYADVDKYIYDGAALKQVDKTNQAYYFDLLSQQNFSLFPMYKVDYPQDQALLITASGKNTPTIQDLKKSRFARLTGQQLVNTTPVRVLHFGKNISPYWSALAEVDAIQLYANDEETILQNIDNQQFISNQENDHTVVIADSKLKIIETPGEATTFTDAPDHLLRLFAYNDLLQAVGRNYFDKKYLEQSLIQQAEEANIVTPVSSLIVLETQEDYDRFDIKKSNNSLDNAAIKKSGAVPEPGEWLLIFLTVGVLVFLWKQN